jgi:tRNA(fMet)-specific endonuclease VapC
MSYLLDTNICSAHIRRPSGLFHRFQQHFGRLFISTVVLGELYAWAFRRDDPYKLIDFFEEEILPELGILPYEENCAFEFGKIRGAFIKQGIAYDPVDLMIAATALFHDLTLITHNVADFRNVPNLRIEDWLAP